ncbi:unnamed protein product [marine sediment metagenome]|uniref:Uncharacterized protein n=1 Tax=marine sediment metagenome TaxID=412755 RepID=X1AHZ1_9ZZZZ
MNAFESSGLHDLVENEHLEVWVIAAEQVSDSGPYFDDMQKIFQLLFKENKVADEKELVELDIARVETQLAKMSQVSAREKKRALLIIRFHQLLAQKYQLSVREIGSHLERGKRIGMPSPDSLIKALEETDIYTRLDAILSYLQGLKDIILSEQESIGLENIYHKRHIAANIPSMYGSYHEPKFDALGLSFRLENLANTLFEELVATMNLRIITRSRISVKVTIDHSLDGYCCTPIVRNTHDFPILSGLLTIP